MPYTLPNTPAEERRSLCSGAAKHSKDVLPLSEKVRGSGPSVLRRCHAGRGPRRGRRVRPPCPPQRRRWGARGANPSRCSVMRARCSTGPRPCQRAAPVPVSRGDAMQAAVQGEDAGLTLRVLPKGGDGECGANPSRSSVMRTGCSAGVAQAPDLGRCGSRPRYTHQTQNTRLRTHLRKVVQLQPAHRRTPAASKQGRNHQPSKQSPSSALVSFESAQKKLPTINRRRTIKRPAAGSCDGDLCTTVIPAPPLPQPTPTKPSRQPPPAASRRLFSHHFWYRGSRMSHEQTTSTDDH